MAKGQQVFKRGRPQRLNNVLSEVVGIVDRVPQDRIAQGRVIGVQAFHLFQLVLELHDHLGVQDCNRKDCRFTQLDIRILRGRKERGPRIGRSSKTRSICVGGWRRSIQRFANRPSAKTLRFTGAMKWAFDPILLSDAPMGFVGKRL